MDVEEIGLDDDFDKQRERDALVRDIRLRYKNALKLIKKYEKEVDVLKKSGELLVESKANGLVNHPMIAAYMACLQKYVTISNVYVKLTEVKENKTTDTKNEDDPMNW